MNIELSKLKFSIADELTFEDVEREHSQIGSPCNKILNGLFEGLRIGVEIPPILIDGDFEVQDGYHRVACLLYLNVKYPDDYNFTSIEAKLI